MGKEKVSEQVYKILEQRIVNREWREGEKISSENELVKELGVSRISVRAAIEKFVALGILIKKKGGGTYISQLETKLLFNTIIPFLSLNPSSYNEISEFRRILEVPQIKKFAEKATDEDVIHLKEIYGNMKKYKDTPKFYYYDLEFHNFILSRAGNTLIEKISQIIFSFMERYQKFLYETLGPEGGLKEHLFLIDAIEKRDPELAELYMKRHLERVVKELSDLDK